MKPLLQVKNLVTQFHVEDGVIQAVNGISIALMPGEILAIVGESGSGKSVSMLSVMGLIPQPPGKIVSGEILLDGRDLTRLSKSQMARIRGKEIAMIFQDPMTSLNPVMSIGRQIDEALLLHMQIDKAAARKRTIELLEMVGIPDAANRARDFPHQFSGGMRQRVMIAMALACNPKVLIADEPTTALDVTIQAQIIALVKRLQRELGMAVVWITHDLGVVASLADRVAVMYAGRIVEQGTVDDIFTRPRHPYTLGLLRSLPRLDKAHRGIIQEIPGSPPNASDLPPGCAFAPRCTYNTAQCTQTLPALMDTDIPEHRSACLEWEQLAAMASAPATS